MCKIVRLRSLTEAAASSRQAIDRSDVKAAIFVEVVGSVCAVPAGEAAAAAFLFLLPSGVVGALWRASYISIFSLSGYSRADGGERY
jgi:hypothetical protein